MFHTGDHSYDVFVDLKQYYQHINKEKPQEYTFSEHCKTQTSLTCLFDIKQSGNCVRIKETVMAGLYIDMLQLGANSPDAIRLKNYRAPKTNFGEAGDFASVLYNVLVQRSGGV